jgi:hypothetical protein
LATFSCASEKESQAKKSITTTEKEIFGVVNLMVPAFEAKTNRGGEIDGATREAFISLWKRFYIKTPAYLKLDGRQLAHPTSMEHKLC